jgi:hypothetical protein
MGVAMRDLDDDGALDLVQLAHSDMTLDSPRRHRLDHEAE